MMHSHRPFSPSTQIGRGHFADVHRGVHPESSEPVAVKLLRTEHLQNARYVERFRREIRITRSLDGVPGVVRILHDGGDARRPFYVMPLADQNLEEYIRTRNQQLADSDRRAICATLLGTISEAHLRGVLHRDLSPRNVLCFKEANPRFQVADFGLCKSAAELEALTSSSQFGFGALLYAAPEQRESLAQSSARSDVYSLGRLIDFIFTGRDPDNAQEHALRPVSRRACDPDAESRYPNAVDLQRAFELHCNIVFGGSDGSVEALTDLGGIADVRDWAQVHRVLVNSGYSGRAFYGYLEPVMQFMETPGRLKEYTQAIGDTADAFVDRFCREVEVCESETGWPFSEGRRFYGLLRDLFVASRGLSTKVKCFRVLWSSAYCHDQWSAQACTKSVLHGIRADAQLQVEIAAVIAELRGKYMEDSLLTVAPTGPIRNAIQLALRDRDQADASE